VIHGANAASDAIGGAAKAGLKAAGNIVKSGAEVAGDVAGGGFRRAFDVPDRDVGQPKPGDQKSEAPAAETPTEPKTPGISATVKPKADKSTSLEEKPASPKRASRGNADSHQTGVPGPGGTNYTIAHGAHVSGALEAHPEHDGVFVDPATGKHYAPPGHPIHQTGVYGMQQVGGGGGYFPGGGGGISSMRRGSTTSARGASGQQDAQAPDVAAKGPSLFSRIASGAKKFVQGAFAARDNRRAGAAAGAAKPAVPQTATVPAAPAATKVSLPPDAGSDEAPPPEAKPAEATPAEPKTTPAVAATAKPEEPKAEEPKAAEAPAPAKAPAVPTFERTPKLGDQAPPEVSRTLPAAKPQAVPTFKAPASAAKQPAAAPGKTGEPAEPRTAARSEPVKAEEPQKKEPGGLAARTAVSPEGKVHEPGSDDHLHDLISRGKEGRTKGEGKALFDHLRSRVETEDPELYAKIQKLPEGQKAAYTQAHRKAANTAETVLRAEPGYDRLSPQEKLKKLTASVHTAMNQWADTGPDRATKAEKRAATRAEKRAGRKSDALEPTAQAPAPAKEPAQPATLPSVAVAQDKADAAKTAVAGAAGAGAGRLADAPGKEDKKPRITGTESYSPPLHLMIQEWVR
jgi:hypothetical protein